MGGSDVNRLGIEYSGTSLPTWEDEALMVWAAAAILRLLRRLVLVELSRLLVLLILPLLCRKTVRGRGRVRRARGLITQLAGYPAL